MANKKYNRSIIGTTKDVSGFFVDAHGKYSNSDEKNNADKSSANSEIEKEEVFSPKFAIDSWNRFVEKNSKVLNFLKENPQ